MQRSLQAQQDKAHKLEEKRAKTPFIEYTKGVIREPYNVDLLKSVADTRVIIPQNAEIIYSPDKMFRDKELPVPEKVQDLMYVSKTYSRNNSKS